ncbi:RNA polymerase factor sigma-54 [Alicyclobacillus herbarius]|uniref:RNA polymerase factor sigma-54 n=1 Tax=Alicyclobacillus herbarius TaxID=122960 RepID=UPI000687F6D4|nr:RNA polymerase factor sigma-54 [Alicyclobacillus herbarius]
MDMQSMDMQYELVQEQTQKLVMTVQMRQAIELLQCATVELDQMVASLSLDNPLVEYEPPQVGRKELWKWLEENDKTPRSPRWSDDDTERPAAHLAAEPNLWDELDLQLRTADAPPRVVQLARRLLGFIDENGYLVELPPAEAWGHAACYLDEAIALLQSCDPPGIGARSLKECLLLQVNSAPVSVRPLLRRLIEDHLEDVASARWQRMGQALAEPKEHIQEAVDALRRLNPRPGLKYATAAPLYVVPELTVRKVENRYVVLPYEAAYPKLRWNRSYLRLMEAPPDAATAEYLRSKQQAVEWLARCLEQRRLTLQRVGEAIVAAQQAFFEFGPGALRPLTLREVADELGMHESTVSRATRGKYMQTPRGILELKAFFSTELSSEGQSVSAEAVKEQIRQWVAAEDPRHPLSDQAICERLKAAGIHVSRRTVAKYREQMSIPSSNKRRRLA